MPHLNSNILHNVSQIHVIKLKYFHILLYLKCSQPMKRSLTYHYDRKYCKNFIYILYDAMNTTFIIYVVEYLLSCSMETTSSATILTQSYTYVYVCMCMYVYVLFLLYFQTILHICTIIF